jgi:hypothetical protein
VKRVKARSEASPTARFSLRRRGIDPQDVQKETADIPVSNEREPEPVELVESDVVRYMCDSDTKLAKLPQSKIEPQKISKD